jgi:myo-inositol-1-phosphate synthase
MSEKVTDALVAAGILTDAHRISRIVIDLQPGMVPVLHVRYFGDERLLDVVETLDGTEVKDGG